MQKLDKNIESVVMGWPSPIRREICSWLGGALCGHGSKMSRAASSRWRYLLKKIAKGASLATLFVSILNSDASEIKFAWNASPSIGVTNYNFYASTNGLSLTNFVSRLPVGTNCTATVSDLTPGVWQFSVTAMRDGAQSDFCNILTIEIPEPPARMRTVILQFSGTLTNFFDVGFFKLRLP